MERLGKPRHGGEGRRLSEREVSESHPMKLPLSCATGFLNFARNDICARSTVTAARYPTSFTSDPIP
jgi:hypothetical protein